MTLHAVHADISLIALRSMRLVEAITRSSVDRALKPRIAKLEQKIARIFTRQGNALAQKMSALRPYFVESDLDSDFDSIFNSSTLDSSSDMLDTLEKAIDLVLLDGADALIANVKVGISFSLDNPRAVAYTRDRAAEAITQIDNHTRSDIKAMITAGIENGESYDSIARKIKTKYKEFAEGRPQEHIKSRAHLVAVTELGTAYQAGNFIAAKTCQASGIAMQKYWQTSNDSKVSEGCKENQAVGWIGIDEQFPSGDDHPLRFPGCRCVLKYRRDKSQTAPEDATTAFDPQTFATGSAADKYYTKNSALQPKDLDYAHQSAMQAYQGEGYKGINGALRSGDKKQLAEWANEIKRIDTTLDRIVTTEDIQSHRGMYVVPGSPAAALLDSWQVGETFKERGYMSTTVDQKGVSKFLNSISAKDRPKGATDVYIEVRIPKGTHALYMNAAVEARNGMSYKEERELLLARDTEYRIVSREVDSKGKTRVIMEIIP